MKMASEDRAAHLLFSELFPSVDLSRSQKRQLEILQAAVSCYGDLGFESTTFEEVARRCRVSRPLIQHYFDNREELFLLAMRYVRINTQNYVLEKMRGSTHDPELLLESYVRAHFSWWDDFPQHVQTWLLYISRCAFDSKCRGMHTELVNIGNDRIQGMLKAGNAAGVFSSEDVAGDARTIQLLITGALLCLVTENRDSEKKKITDLTLQKVMSSVKGRVSSKRRPDRSKLSNRK